MPRLSDITKSLNLLFLKVTSFMTAILTLSHGDKRPVGYYSKRISTTERGTVACLGTVVAATEAALATSDIVAMCPLTVHVPPCYSLKC